MKSAKQIRLYHRSQSNSKSNQPLLEQFYASKPVQNLNLTEQELIKINLLIPRLCLSGHLTTAIRLLVTTTSLIATNPPPKSISFSILIHSLTSQSEIDMSKSMSLLTILRRHNPNYLTPITTMLITSYLKNNRPKDAFKLYQWMLRPGSPSTIHLQNTSAYQFMVIGFCEFGFSFEALRILGDMVAAVGFVPGPGLRTRVFRSLLKDGHVNQALAFIQLSHSNAAPHKFILFLDSVIRSWTD